MIFQISISLNYLKIKKCFKIEDKNNVITVVFKFAGKIRNKAIPLFSEKQNFTQQITVPGNPRYPLRNSEVVVLNISAS